MAKWLKEEIEYLKKNYASQPIKTTAAFLQKSVKSIQNKALSLKLGRSKKYWSKDNLEFLKNNHNLSYNELSKKLNKSEQNIYLKLKYLGIKKETPKRKTKKTNYNLWSNEDIEFVINNYKTNGIEYCSEKLNRTKKSIQHIICSINKEIPSRYLDKDYLYEEFVLKDKSIPDIAKENNLTVNQVRLAIAKNNIKKEKRTQYKKNKSKIWKGFEELPGTMFYQIKRGALQRNKEFNLDIEYLWNLYLEQDKKCAYTKLDINFYDCKNKASLDRIDSTKGYIKGNVQWIDKRVNFMKNDFSEEEFFKLCELIIKNRKK